MGLDRGLDIVLPISNKIKKIIKNLFVFVVRGAEWRCLR
jgi:hypothetical protein